MMTDQSELDGPFQRVLRLASERGLADVVPGSSYRTPALKVDDRSFARMLDSSTLVLQCPLEQKVLLMEISPDIYFETDHYVGYDTVLVRLDAIEDEELSLRLEDAWRFKRGQDV
jgi:hypothetical protein